MQRSSPGQAELAAPTDHLTEGDIGARVHREVTARGDLDHLELGPRHLADLEQLHAVQRLAVELLERVPVWLLVHRALDTLAIGGERRGLHGRIPPSLS